MVGNIAGWVGSWVSKRGLSTRPDVTAITTHTVRPSSRSSPSTGASPGIQNGKASYGSPVLVRTFPYVCFVVGRSRWEASDRERSTSCRELINRERQRGNRRDAHQLGPQQLTTALPAAILPITTQPIIALPIIPLQPPLIVHCDPPPASSASSLSEISRAYLMHLHSPSTPAILSAAPEGRSVAPATHALVARRARTCRRRPMGSSWSCVSTPILSCPSGKPRFWNLWCRFRIL